MKIIKKIGYGLLSLITLFFYTVSNGFPRGRTFNSIKEKVLKIQKHDAGTPETLILAQPDSSYSDEIISHTSHRSHSSHRSHASHSSGVSGRVVSKPITTKAAPGTTVYANPYVRHLTVAEVEMISGLNGIQQTLEPTVLHFLQNDGKEILRVKFSGKEYFNSCKSDPKYSPISGLGEAALVGTLQLPMQLLFVKGKHCVEILTFPKEGLNMYLTLDQMRIAANYISSRLTD